MTVSGIFSLSLRVVFHSKKFREYINKKDLSFRKKRSRASSEIINCFSD